MPLIDVVMGDDVSLAHRNLVHLSGCKIGAGSRIGPFVEILEGTVIGARCKISSHSFICQNVKIGDGVFIGHGVAITPDARRPVGNQADSILPSDPPVTTIGDGASIGSRATIMAGCRIGKSALVGAGAVVMDDVPDGTIVVGVPARPTGTSTAPRRRPRAGKTPKQQGASVADGLFGVSPTQ